VKLIGSQTENEYRTQLISSHKFLFDSDKQKGILSVLYMRYPEIKTAYILDWIPDQDIEIYKILIDTNLIVVVEVDHDDNGRVFITQEISIKAYKKHLSKTGQIRLAVAMDLAQADIG